MEWLFEVSDELLSDKVTFPSQEQLEKTIGYIMLNRISGISYDKFNLVGFNPEAKKILKMTKDIYEKHYKHFIHNLSYLSKILLNFQTGYALLKGAYLTTFLYNIGHRTSNDIDILVTSQDVSRIQDLLLDNGFVQGHVDSGIVVQATRKKIIESKMNNGETIPFLKQMDDNILEIDINFSLDFKPEQDKKIVSEMLASAGYVAKEDMRFKTLRFDDFLIHLCCHLYKEATTYDWVLSRRDLMLYKFSDINVFVHNHGTNQYFDNLIERIKHFGLEKECYYAFENASVIYPNLNKTEGFVKVKETIRPSDLAFMTQVIWPRKKKLFQHSLSFTEWFFSSDRIAQLEEVPYETN